MSNPLDLLGFFGSIFVVASLSQSSAWRLRVLNLFGAVTMVVYGLLLGAVPVVALNIVITSLDAWHLARLYRERRASAGDERPVLAPVPARAR